MFNNKKTFIFLAMTIILGIAFYLYFFANNAINNTREIVTPVAETNPQPISNTPRLTVADFSLTKINYQQLPSARIATIAYQQQNAQNYHIGDFIQNNYVVEQITENQVTLANYEDANDLIILKLKPSSSSTQKPPLTKQEQIKQVTDYFIDKALINPPQTEEEFNNLYIYFYTDKRRILDVDVDRIEKSGMFVDQASLEAIKNFKETQKDIAKELATEAGNE